MLVSVLVIVIGVVWSARCSLLPVTLTVCCCYVVTELIIVVLVVAMVLLGVYLRDTMNRFGLLQATLQNNTKNGRPGGKHHHRLRRSCSSTQLTSMRRHGRALFISFLYFYFRASKIR